ncbi:DMT family transporter [Saccharopolyspora sp. NPDC002578]
MAWVMLVCAITAEVVATSFLKASEGLTKLLPSVVVAVSYITAFTMLGKALKTMELGIAYAIWSGVGTAAIALVGIMFMGESAAPVKLFGLGLITVGVVMLNVTTSH